MKTRKKPTQEQIEQIQQAADNSLKAINKLVEALDKRLFKGIAERFHARKNGKQA